MQPKYLFGIEAVEKKSLSNFINRIPSWFIGFSSGVIISGLFQYYFKPAEFINPQPVNATILVIVTPTPTQTPTPAPIKKYVGLASYYSEKNCLGCSASLTMANGQKLDDNNLTVAFNKAPLNSQVLIKNLKNGKKVVATVTDRGGFERHGKIIDLSVRTKSELGCLDVCKVEITYL